MGRRRNSVLDIRNLSIEFATTRGRLKALRDVTLSVPQEKIVGLVGESGCGKSTVIFSIIHLLAENAVVTGGEIDFEGRDIVKMSPSDLRAIRGDRISMVFQDPMTSLNPVLSIDTQMTDIQYRANIGMEEKRTRAVEMLARVGIPDPRQRLSNYPHHFSGGMRQRISIAMALLANPALLLADEQWPRRSRIEVDGFDDGLARVARGSDFLLVVRADRSRQIVPDVVELREVSSSRS